jgi:spermidine/putrescine transport system permease protein
VGTTTPIAQSRPMAQVTRDQRTAAQRWGNGTLWTITLAGFLFLYLPILVLVLFSFNEARVGGQWTGFTLQWYRELAQDRDLISAFANSLQVAAVATVISTVLGTMAALAMERFRFRGKTVVDAVLYMPVAIPDIVMAVSLLAFFSLALTSLNDVLGWNLRLGLGTVIIAHVAFSISFVCIAVRTALKNFDRRLEEAAADLGADELTTFRLITLPLIAPGIISGALLAFTLSLDDYIISFFTTGPGGTTLPIEVYSAIRRSISPEINAISTIMLAFSIGLVLVSQMFQRNQTR